MRPLIITALYPPAVGGAATYFGDIVPKLAQQEKIEHLLVLTEKMAGQPCSESNDRFTVLRALPTRVSLPVQTKLAAILRYAQAQLWFSWKLRNLIQRQQIDFIHFHTRYRGFPFFRALQRCGLPILADLRDKMSDPAKLTGVATRLLCCSQGVYQFAVAGGFPAQSCDLVPVAFQLPSTISPEEVKAVRGRYLLPPEPYILYAGDITIKKGIYEMLEAFQTWQKKHPRVQLVIAGTNREGKKFLQQIKEMNQIIYLGRVPHQDTLALIQGAEILLLPSRSEGLPRVILEAISLQTKVICPPHIPEFDQYLASCVLPDVSASSLVHLMETVWLMPNAPTYPLSNHALDNIVKNLTAVYQKLI